MPVYENCSGWRAPLDGIRDRAHLPREAKAYLQKIEATVGAPVGMVGIGPERSATLL
jgi:adenylosuccinate synthase